MDDAKKEWIRGWLTKASHDLTAARLLGYGRRGHPGCADLPLPAGGGEGDQSVPGGPGPEGREDARRRFPDRTSDGIRACLAELPGRRRSTDSVRHGVPVSGRPGSAAPRGI